MNPRDQNSQVPRRRLGFFEDFRRFFLRGLAAVLPTLITLWLLVRLWDFLWEALGQHIIWGVRYVWLTAGGWWFIPREPGAHIHAVWDEKQFGTRVMGVGLAILLVYVVGVFVGNFIGRTLWRLIEVGVMRIPLVRAIYPSVKQVTDFVLSERKGGQFSASQVVAVQPHAKGIWSIGLVTGSGIKPLSETAGQDMVTVFIPSSPTAFTGYVLVVPRESVIELPLTVEEAMRLLVSGGVIAPGSAVLDASGKVTPEAARGKPSDPAPTLPAPIGGEAVARRVNPSRR